MKQSAYFLDFDGTLFDTNRFREAIVPFLERSEASVDIWRKAQDIFRERMYAFSEHIKEVNRIMGGKRLRPTLEQEFFDTFANLSTFLYPDIALFLEQAKSENIKLFLLTRGDPRWQGYKVRSSGIEPLFDGIHFTPEIGKKGIALAKECAKEAYEHIVAADDTSEELDAIKKAEPRTVTYLISRDSKNDTHTQSIHRFCSNLFPLLHELDN